jgi:prevent-host-death family protein
LIDMTSHDHNRVMTKVGIADLKAHLSEHLRGVRKGQTVTIMDRERPIAQIVPHDETEALAVRPATRKPGQLRLPAPMRKKTDSVALLLRDRASR